MTNQHHAALSHGAYERVSKAQDRAAKHGYKVVDAFTDKSKVRSHTLYEKDDGNVVLAFRGTSVKRSKLKDLLTDAQLLVGAVPKELRQARRVAEQVKQQYGDRVVLAGHSLGGGKAIYAGKNTGLRSITHNPYVTSGMRSGLKNYFKQTGSEAHVHMEDPVGLSSTDHIPHEHVVAYTHETTKHPHSISEFHGAEGVPLAGSAT